MKQAVISYGTKNHSLCKRNLRFYFLPKKKDDVSFAKKRRE